MLICLCELSVALHNSAVNLVLFPCNDPINFENVYTCI